MLANPLIDPDTIMQAFSRAILERAAHQGEPLVLILDQSKVSDRHQVLMLVMALALYCAVSTGLWDAENHPTPAEKKL